MIVLEGLGVKGGGGGEEKERIVGRHKLALGQMRIVENMLFEKWLSRGE
jgi:hypothetical protein